MKNRDKLGFGDLVVVPSAFLELLIPSLRILQSSAQFSNLLLVLALPIAFSYATNFDTSPLEFCDERPGQPVGASPRSVHH